MDRVPLEKCSAVILDMLERERAAMHQHDMAVRLDVDRKTLRPALRRLLDLGLIALPWGPRSGYVITDEGRRALALLPNSARFRFGLPLV